MGKHENVSEKHRNVSWKPLKCFHETFSHVIWYRKQKLSFLNSCFPAAITEEKCVQEISVHETKIKIFQLLFHGPNFSNFFPLTWETCFLEIFLCFPETFFRFAIVFWNVSWKQMFPETNVSWKYESTLRRKNWFLCWLKRKHPVSLYTTRFFKTVAGVVSN